MARGNDLTLKVGRAIAAVGDTWLHRNDARTDGKPYEVGYTDGEAVSPDQAQRVLGAFEEREDAVAFWNDVVALRRGQAALSAIEANGYVIKPADKPVMLDGVPVDNPRFDDRSAVNDWRCEVGSRTAAVWSDLTTPQRLAIAQDAQIAFAKSQQVEGRWGASPNSGWSHCRSPLSLRPSPTD
jgi:hypothetical protein